MTPDRDPRASDIPTGIATNGIGKVSTSHINLTVCISLEPPRPGTAEAFRDYGQSWRPAKAQAAGAAKLEQW